MWGEQKRGTGVQEMCALPGGEEGAKVAYDGGTIKRVQITDGEATMETMVSGIKFPMCGLGIQKTTGTVFYATANGEVHLGAELLFKSLFQSSAKTNVLRSARASPEGDIQKILTGGRNSELTLWDTATRAKVWQAKNVPHDFLDMPVPVY